VTPKAGGPPPSLSVGPEDGTEDGEVDGPSVGPEDGREDGAEDGFFVGAPTGESVIPLVEIPKGTVGDLVGDMVSADPLLPHPQANVFVYWHCCTFSGVPHLGGGVALSRDALNLESCT
jgi:hypothetical protein